MYSSTSICPTSKQGKQRQGTIPILKPNLKPFFHPPKERQAKGEAANQAVNHWLSGLRAIAESSPDLTSLVDGQSIEMAPTVLGC